MRESDKRGFTMNNVLLINRINPNDQSSMPEKITFIIGDMHLEETHQKIYELVQTLDFVCIEELIIKYNGITVPLNISKIPDVIKEFCTRDIKLYGVYGLYEE